MNEEPKSIIRFNLFAFIIVTITSIFMSYQLGKVGVPDGVVTALVVGNVFLFPWRPFTIIKPEGDEPDASN